MPIVTGAEDFDDDDDTTTQTGSQSENPNDLRNQNKKLKRDLAAAQAQLKTFNDRFRSEDATKLLEKNGANPKLAKMLLRELGDAEVNEAAVKKWLEEDGELFGWKPADVKPADNGDKLDPNVDAATAAEAARTAEATRRAPDAQGGLTLEFLQNASDKELIARGLINERHH
jgi:hypothetical protein